MNKFCTSQYASLNCGVSNTNVPSRHTVPLGHRSQGTWMRNLPGHTESQKTNTYRSTCPAATQRNVENNDMVIKFVRALRQSKVCGRSTPASRIHTVSRVFQVTRKIVGAPEPHPDTLASLREVALKCDCATALLVQSHASRGGSSSVHRNATARVIVSNSIALIKHSRACLLWIGDRTVSLLSVMLPQT